MKKIGLGLLILLTFLIIPFITKDRSSLIKNFKDVSLKEMTFTEIEFINLKDQIKLGGMLFLPETKDSIPVAILIHGSGYSNRENTWYLTLTKHLLNSGIAVLLPDKRGSEKSEGDWKGMSIEELAADTEAAINFARSLPNQFSKIGLIGMSQGGWIAPVVASRTPLDFVVDVSGTLATGNYQLEFEEAHNIAQYTYYFLAKPISKLTVSNLKKKPHINIYSTFDPLPYWEKVSIPNFIAFGENDTNCPIERSLERIEEHQINHLNIKVYPNGRHAIVNSDGTDYNSQFLADLIQFIKTNK